MAIYDVVALGSILLVIYIVIDVIKNRTKNLLRRIIFYSFIFYLLNVIQLTTGGIVLPPQKDVDPRIQVVPLHFVGDLYGMYHNNGLDWFFWNSVKLSVYNLIMLMPLGIYLSVLFRLKRFSKSFFVVLMVSLTIEISQLIFGFLGFIRGRTFNVDDLILNTLGGLLGFVVVELIKRIIIFAKNKKDQGVGA
ncbi:VanZ family protein [Pontibacillus sp. ALD_SL1]|uniref:VanZ family protein n=1 Tax=Pontibacillus sp. ALD_SL1 TaxID=2777185 RepID=UPI001F5FFE19|nr:VanZ family protein [Pontibacillus sp. ALD_SL1]